MQLVVDLHTTDVRSIGMDFPPLVSSVLLDLLQPYLLLLEQVVGIFKPGCCYEGDLPESLGSVPERSFHLGDVSVGALTGRLG